MRDVNVRCLIVCLVCVVLPGFAGERPPAERGRNQLVVSPHGPDDGGDFGPNTPGTQTSGLQEALNAAKEQAKDVYVAGGSWTADKTVPVVYNLNATLHIPWMQNFRFDSGHGVLNYVKPTGDAVVFDSQMSCSYRFGLIVSLSDGAVVRLKPTAAGPDRFKVITSTEFTFNALVGGGGAWPGGEPYNSNLKPGHEWKGAGLWLDGSEGSIDANKITVIETVGCRTGLLLTGGVSRNTIEETNIHLCADHLRIGGADDARPCDNRIEAFLDCQGIKPSSGARISGARNMLTLSLRPGLSEFDVRFEKPAAHNLVLLHSPGRCIDESEQRSNRVIAAGGIKPVVPPVPPSGESCRNENPFSVAVRIVKTGNVANWSVQEGEGAWTEFASPLTAGQTIVLAPGERLRLDYTEPPSWEWRTLQ